MYRAKITCLAFALCDLLVLSTLAVHGQDENKPDLLTAPFSVKAASDSQSAWELYLGSEFVKMAKPVKLQMEMVLIPPGEFQMGSPESESERGDREAQHKVRINRAFLLGVYEVTQAEYIAVVVENPSSFSATGSGSVKVGGQNTERFPIEMISWLDAVTFCNALSNREGKKAVYTIKGRNGNETIVDEEANGFRLPTEAEWEYACRGGTTSPFYFGVSLNGREANVNGNYPYGTTTKGPSLWRTTRIGSYGANSFGLHDMHGNVSEWCWDWFGDPPVLGSDPSAASTNGGRVVRGGAWSSDPNGCRSAANLGLRPAGRSPDLGFRVATSLFVEPK